MLKGERIQCVDDLMPILKGSHSLFSYNMKREKGSIYLCRKGNKLNKYLFVFMSLLALLSGLVGGAGLWGFFIVSGLFTLACFVSLYWLRKSSRESVFIDLKKSEVSTCSLSKVPFSAICNLELIEKRAHSEDGYFQLVCELNIALKVGGRVNLAVGEVGQMDHLAQELAGYIDCHIAYKKL